MTIGVGGVDVGGAIEKAKTKSPKVDKGFLDVMKKAASGAKPKEVVRGNLKEKALLQLDRDTRARFFKDKEAFADSNSIKTDNKPKLFREFLKKNVLNNATRGKDTDSSAPYQHHMETKLETFFNPERGNGLPEDKHAHRPPREIGKKEREKQEDINLKIDPGPLFK